MFDLIVILVLLALAFPVIAIVALVSALSLRNVVARLDGRVRALELGPTPRGALAAHATAEPAPTPTSEPEPAATPGPEPSPPAATAAETPTPPPLPPHLPPPVPPAPPRTIGFEERFGTRWVVWVGGIALALGGVFLVRYTIQQGLIGPGVRIALGALLAFALIAVGEWTRRNERLSGLPGLPTADIPSILTAAGTVVAYATVYAAYALYEFLPPGAAFILLGIVALATLAAALLHGPALAGLGVVGAFVTPLLIASERPDFNEVDVG